MKRSLLQRTLCVAGAAAAATTTLALAAPAAHAVPVPVVVAAGGSDTTQDVMGDILAGANGTTVTYNGNQYTVTARNIPAYPLSAVSVPGDANCPTTSWTKDPLAPSGSTTPTKGISPFGSGAGRDYLNFEENTAPAGEKGCIDIARSSSGKRTTGTTNGTDGAQFEYFAYGLDAVSWASTSLKAPSTLTLAQIQGIYNCSITNWDQVGGTSGPIVPYLPQPGSGTRSFFISAFLGGVTPSASCVPSSKEIEENQGQTVAAADIDKAILPYSAGLWDYQQSNKANPTIDKRNGAKLGGYTTGAGSPVKANPAQWVAGDNQYELATPALVSFLGLPASYAVVSEVNVKTATPGFNANTDYNGIRYIYNVINKAAPTAVYESAKALVGFDTVGGAGAFKSPLCNGDNAGSIQSFGLATLDTSNPNSLNPTASTCRKV